MVFHFLSFGINFDSGVNYDLAQRAMCKTNKDKEKVKRMAEFPYTKGSSLLTVPIEHM